MALCDCNSGRARGDGVGERHRHVAGGVDCLHGRMSARRLAGPALQRALVAADRLRFRALKARREVLFLRVAPLSPPARSRTVWSGTDATEAVSPRQTHLVTSHMRWSAVGQSPRRAISRHRCMPSQSGVGGCCSTEFLWATKRMVDEMPWPLSKRQQMVLGAQGTK